MGFFTSVFLGPECKYCGKRSLEDDDPSKGLFPFEIKYCRSCGRYQVFGNIPRCYRCGTPQTNVTINEYGAPLPTCPKCGYVWDGE